MGLIFRQVVTWAKIIPTIHFGNNQFNVIQSIITCRSRSSLLPSLRQLLLGSLSHVLQALSGRCQDPMAHGAVHGALLEVAGWHLWYRSMVLGFLTLVTKRGWYANGQWLVMANNGWWMMANAWWMMANNGWWTMRGYNPGLTVCETIPRRLKENHYQ